MDDLEYIRVGDPADFNNSSGFKAWKQRHDQRSKSSCASVKPIVREFTSVRAGISASRATRLRDLEVMELEARIVGPPAVSKTASLHAAPNGHFYAQAVFDARSVVMMVDTGATWCTLTEEDANKLGFRLRSSDFTRKLSTQNGLISVAPVHVSSMRIGAVSISNVETVVTKRMPGNESLIGMSFLNRLREFSMENGRLILRG